MDLPEISDGLPSNSLKRCDLFAIKAVTSNADLLGKYTEACIRRLVRRVVYPMHVSTGAVIDYPLPSRPLKQLDVAIWSISHAPALFEVEDFALVPRSSAFGVLKSSAAITPAFTKNSKQLFEIMAQLLPTPESELKKRHCHPGCHCCFGKATHKRLQKLMDTDKVVAFLQKQGREMDVRTNDPSSFRRTSFTM